MNLDTNKTVKLEKEETLENLSCFKEAKAYQAEMFEEIDKLKAIFQKEN